MVQGGKDAGHRLRWGHYYSGAGQHWESLYTHRFAGPAADDAERTKRLLELMKSYGGTARAASWVEALAIADRGRILASWENQGASGLIADQPTEIPKERGFWVFSMWYFPQFDKTYNQLTDEERRALNDHWLQLKDQVQHFFRYEYREERTSPLPLPPNL